MSTHREEQVGLEKLLAWQKARELMLFVHQQVIPLLPADEKWDLKDQIRRSSKSAMANIAEGHGRFYYQETVHFCYIARGSLEETFSHLITAHDLSYISDSLFSHGDAIVHEALQMLNGYIAYLKKTKQGGDLSDGGLKEIGSDYDFSEIEQDDAC